MRVTKQVYRAAILLMITLTFGGCAISQPVIQSAIQPAKFTNPISHSKLLNRSEIASAETTYADAIELDKQDDPRCLSNYVDCCRELWPRAIKDLAEARQSRALDLYRSSVGRFIESSQRLGRLNLADGIQLASSTLPIRFVGLPWRIDEINQFASIGKYEVRDEIVPQTQEGLGIPLVATRVSDRPFVRPDGAFPVTALLRPAEDGSMILVVLNPHGVRQIMVHGRSIPIAFDLTAPLAYYEEQFQKTWLTGFLRPEKTEMNDGLLMVTPYQRGRIPLLLVHGLASDPMTWAAMANALSVHPEVMQYYQLWLFQYPTGTPFPMEAARLREQLVELRNNIDPEHRDPALDNIVVIGHSMGGLMAKLQITSSGDQLAKAILSKPASELSLSPELERKFRSTIFFEPSEQIRRVIFLGTPHRGSRIASSAVGRLASNLVREPAEMVSSFGEFARENTDALVAGKSEIPTSVDLLRPGNPVLETIFGLPVAPQIKLHSVIGASHGGRFGKELSDGVVPVSSARHPGVESELLVDAGHGLHHHEETIHEVIRILKLHRKLASVELDIATSADQHAHPLAPIRQR